jgi:hypothetical protein
VEAPARPRPTGPRLAHASRPRAALDDTEPAEDDEDDADDAVVVDDGSVGDADAAAMLLAWLQIESADPTLPASQDAHRGPVADACRQVLGHLMSPLQASDPLYAAKRGAYRFILSEYQVWL